MTYSTYWRFSGLGRREACPYIFIIQFYPPIITVTAPGDMTVPPPAVGSPMRAAGIPPIITLVDPITMESAPHVSPSRAAGIPPISTVGAPGGMMGAGAPCVAVLTIMSPTRAANAISFSGFSLSVPCRR
jgi:hypothetical protein